MVRKFTSLGAAALTSALILAPTTVAHAQEETGGNDGVNIVSVFMSAEALKNSELPSLQDKGVMSQNYDGPKFVDKVSSQAKDDVATGFIVGPVNAADAKKQTDQLSKGIAAMKEKDVMYLSKLPESDPGAKEYNEWLEKTAKEKEGKVEILNWDKAVQENKDKLEGEEGKANKAKLENDFLHNVAALELNPAGQKSAPAPAPQSGNNDQKPPVEDAKPAPQADSNDQKQSAGDSKPTPPAGNNDPKPAENNNAPDSNQSNGLAAIAKEIESATGAKVSIAVAKSGESAQKAGSLETKTAWSTSKVPVSLAVFKEKGVVPEMEAALTSSDNEAAKKLWGMLGTPQEAAKKVEEVISKDGGAGQVSVPSEKTRQEFTEFGQTQWDTESQAKFGAKIPSLKGGKEIGDLMGKVVPEQSYGLGKIDGAHFKGGWGPDESGKYLTRQFGYVKVGDKTIGVAIAAESKEGTYESEQVVLDQIAEKLKGELK